MVLSSVCNFGKFINFGLGTVSSERFNSRLVFADSSENDYCAAVIEDGYLTYDPFS